MVYKSRGRKETLNIIIIFFSKKNLIIKLIKKLDEHSMREMIEYKYGKKSINNSFIKNNVLTPAELNNYMLISETIEELEHNLDKKQYKK